MNKSRVEQMLFSLLAVQGTGGGSAPRCEIGLPFVDATDVVTVFDSCGLPEKDLVLPGGAEQHIYKMVEVSRCRPQEVPTCAMYLSMLSLQSARFWHRQAIGSLCGNQRIFLC